MLQALLVYHFLEGLGVSEGGPLYSAKLSDVVSADGAQFCTRDCQR